MQDVLYREPTNIRRCHSQYSRHGNIAPGICAPLDWNIQTGRIICISSFLSLFTFNSPVPFYIFSVYFLPQARTWLSSFLSTFSSFIFICLFYSCLRHALCNFFLGFLLHLFFPLHLPALQPIFFLFAQRFLHFLYLFFAFRLFVFQSSCPTAVSVSLFLPFLKE